MHRRTFLASLAAAAAGGATTAAGSARGSAAGIQSYRLQDTVPELSFYSSGCLLDAAGEPLSDDSVVAVWAEDAASVEDADGNGDAVTYPDGTPIPLVGVDGTVAGFGTTLVDDDADFDRGNEEFVLNVWDELVGGGTVLWDEGHGQFYDLSSFGAFEGYAEENGYDVTATTDLAGDLPDADAAVVTSPSDAFSEAELSALSSFVDDGGAVLLHHQSDYNDYDETANLDDLAAALGVGFRFNDGQVVDPENNGGSDFEPLTSQFNDSFPFFGDREGIGGPGLQPGQRYEVDVTSITDGDTVDVEFDDGSVETIRVLGVDTPESASAAQYERPEEWEGLADETDATGDPVETLQFDSASSLLDPAGDPMTDDSLVAAWAEETATIEDADGNGDAVTYPDGTPIPLVGVDGTVAGFGSMVAADGTPTEFDNEEFLANVWDELIDGDAVLWDEGHDQFYGTGEFGTFLGYVEEEGYDVTATTDLAGDLPDADAAVVTSPSTAFSDDELSALSSFVDDGGAVLLHHQSDYNDFDETANLDDLAAALGAGFRFNDGQVVDPESNSGEPFRPTTGSFNGAAFGAFFENREGLDGGDGPEYPYLAEWAEQATSFAETALAGETVEIYFNENEGVEDPFGRLLAYVDYDSTGDGDRDATYNYRLIEEGLARVYGSTFSEHEAFWGAEATARANGTGLWAESDPENSPPIRNRPVDDLFFPDAASVTTASGPVGTDRVPVSAEPSASPGEAPLAALDEDAGVAMVGSPFVDESYEVDEGYDVDTAGYENFVFLTNLIDALTDAEGDVLIDGGHGQFAVDYALSNEDAAYYQRYLEGVGIGFEQVNGDYATRLADARAVLVTTPAAAFDDGEAAALAEFAADGGAVILLGSAAAPEAAAANLDALADDLGTDLRLGGAVTDGSANVADDPTVPETTNFDGGFDLFDAYDPGDEGGDAPAITVDFEKGRIGDGSDATATLMLSEAPDGLAGYRLDVEIDDPGIVSIDDAFYPSSLGLTEPPEIAEDGSSVTMKAADSNESIEDGATDVPLASVELAAEGAGDVDVTLTVHAMDADGGATMDPVAESGTLTVAPVAPIDGTLPVDLDGDGRYEDLNANGRVDYEDVELLFEHKESSAVTDYVGAYDFNDNGRIDFDDIVRLFEQV